MYKPILKKLKKKKSKPKEIRVPVVAVKVL